MKTCKGLAMPWVIGILVIIAGVVIFVVVQKNQEEQTVMEETVDDVTEAVAQKAMGVKEEARLKGTEAMDQAIEEGKQEAGEVMKVAGEDMLTGGGTYEAYSAEKIAANDGALLFFHASWCPSCRTLDESITENNDNIPEGVAILKLDYDKESDLKKKYAVVGQHTLVQVDKDGNKVTMWRGGNTLDELIAKLQ